MSIYQNITVGCDPEFFLKDAKGGIGAYNFLRGNKWEPTPIDDQGSAVLHDNVMVEFNTAPAATADEFVANVTKVLSFLREKIPAHVEFAFDPSMHFSPKRLRSVKANIFGCEPDFNAWLQGKKNPPIEVEDRTLRTSGGHIHVGYANPREDHNEDLIQHMDLFLGIPSLLLDKNGGERRQMYGKSGAHRNKPYGVEYRVLSNFWIQSEDLMRWAFRNTIRATEFLNAGNRMDDETAKAVVYAIDNNDAELAQQLVQHYNLDLV